MATSKGFRKLLTPSKLGVLACGLMLVLLGQACSPGFQAKNLKVVQLSSSLQPQIGIVDKACGSPGRPKVHRLTKSEYAASVRDLFKLTSVPVTKVPEDDPGRSGFLNDSTYWQFSVQNTQDYIDNAALVMNEVMKSPAKLYSCGQTDTCAKETIRSWMEKIYRRTVDPSEVDAIFATYTTNKPDGFDTALSMSFQAMLASPSFLTRSYDDAAMPVGAIYGLNAFELASQLSYFIWGSTPDEELLKDAKSGSLKDAVVLEKHVRRMLKDARSEALTKNFARYWLSLHRMTNVNPSPQLFPEWNTGIRDAMETEAELFFRHIIAEDLNIETLLKADYTFANETLARIYGISGVTGTNFRKVSLAPAHNRAGILTLGSLLTMNSASDHTRPIGRGLWILTKVMCSEPPAPPPNIPSLGGDDVMGESQIRQRLAVHRSDSNCAGCHALMDPIGLGLELFDPIGRVRTHYRDGVAVDPRGELPVGLKFSSVQEMRDVIVSKDNFKSCFTKHLAAYAIGRPMSTKADTCYASAVASEGAATGKTFADLIVTLAKSPIFLSRDGETK